jgi:hypothetical protein
MADSTININLEDDSKFIEGITQFGAHVKQFRDSIEDLKKFNINIPGGAAPRPSNAPGMDSSIDRQYKRTNYEYQRLSIPLLQSMRGMGGAAGQGLMGIATGGGLYGLMSPLIKELQRSTRGGGGGGLLSALALGGTAGASSGAYAAGKAHGVAAERANIAGLGGAEAEEIGAASGAKALVAGSVLSKLYSAVPLPVKIVGTALVTLGGADIFAMEKATKDVFDRSKIAGGFGMTMGGFTAFDMAMQRFGDPGSMAAGARSAAFDVTSQARIGAGVLGINVGDAQYRGKEGQELLARTIAEQTAAMMRKFYQTNPSQMLTMAHAFKLSDLGFSDEDLVRFAEGTKEEVKPMTDLAKSHNQFLDMSDANQTKFKDLSTSVDFAGAEIRAWGENILQKQIPVFDSLADMIKSMVEDYKKGVTAPEKPYQDYPGVDFSVHEPGGLQGPYGTTPGGHYAAPGAGFGPGRGTSLPIGAEVSKIPSSGSNLTLGARA